MTTGGKSPYPNLRFAAHTDWQHVNPTLLNILQRVAAAHGVTVDVISGYRNNAYSASVGGFAGDPHSRGLAVDAYINGQPIGDVIPASYWAKMGVRSGAVSDFYKGTSDPEHLDLVGEPSAKKWGGSDIPPTASSSASQPTDTTQAPQVPDEAEQNLSTAISTIPQQAVGAQADGPPVADVGTSGSVVDTTYQPVVASAQNTWQLIAGAGPTSQDTQRLAGLASYGSNAAPPGP